MNKGLFLMVEGCDDELFFKKLIVPNLAINYGFVKIIKYSCMTQKEIRKWICSIKYSIHDFIYIKDLDFYPCVSSRIGSEIQKMNDLQYCDIAIVKMEIESWYLAGLSRDFCQALAIKKVEDTTGICKEKFESIIPDQLKPRKNFLNKIIQNFDMKEGLEANSSLGYFINKYCSI